MPPKKNLSPPLAGSRLLKILKRWRENRPFRSGSRLLVGQARQGEAGPAQIPSGLCGVNSRGIGGIFTPHFDPATAGEIVAGPPAEPVNEIGSPACRRQGYFQIHTAFASPKLYFAERRRASLLNSARLRRDAVRKNMWRLNFRRKFITFRQRIRRFN